MEVFSSEVLTQTNSLEILSVFQFNLIKAANTANSKSFGQALASALTAKAQPLHPVGLHTSLF
jgi:hypothetical protein